MNNVFELLLSSPWFWIILVLVILILAFRPQLARLIDRTQKAKAEAGKDGAKIELEAGPSGAADKSPAASPPSASPAGAPPPPAPPGQSVEVGRGAVIHDLTTGDIGNIIVKGDEATPRKPGGRK
jgi:hypothetical protein